jgi:hypothetical protein
MIFYGRNANRIITLANALNESQQRNLTLALDKSWSSWYLKWFDQRDSIELNYFGFCAIKLGSKVSVFPLPSQQIQLRNI